VSVVIVEGRDGLIDRILDRLRERATDDEQLAFAFANVVRRPNGVFFECFEERPVLEDEYERRSSYHIELNDRGRVAITGQAHRLKAALVEFHSHTFDAPACFSISDLSGFRDFVPYIWWRLARPYAAVVVANSSVDGLSWLAPSGEPMPITEVNCASGRNPCTLLSAPERDHQWTTIGSHGK
jgi:hypothetical protein